MSICKLQFEKYSCNRFRIAAASPWVFRARSPFTVLLFVLVDLVHELLELQVLRHQLLPLILAQLVLDDKLYWGVKYWFHGLNSIRGCTHKMSALGALKKARLRGFYFLYQLQM